MGGRGPVRDAELIDADIGRVAAHFARELVGTASAAAVSYDYWIVFTLADGTIRRAEFVETRRQAVEPWGCGSRRCRRRTWRLCASRSWRKSG